MLHKKCERGSSFRVSNKFKVGQYTIIQTKAQTRQHITIRTVSIHCIISTLHCIVYNILTVRISHMESVVKKIRTDYSSVSDLKHSSKKNNLLQDLEYHSEYDLTSSR